MSTRVEISHVVLKLYIINNVPDKRCFFTARWFEQVGRLNTQIEMRLTSKEIPIMKIKLSHDHLIFIMGIWITFVYRNPTMMNARPMVNEELGHFFRHTGSNVINGIFCVAVLS